MKTLIAQSLRFGAVGLINTAVGLLAIYAVIYFFNGGPVVANAIGYSIGFAVSFVLNRLWTFADSRPMNKLLPGYFAVAVFAYLLNLLVVFGGANHFGVNPYLIQLFGIVIYTFVMFFGCRWFVFSTSSFNQIKRKDFWAVFAATVFPALLAVYLFDVLHWDLSVPYIYRNSDDIWQLVLTKAVRDTGWVLTIPSLGAPDIAHWHNNAAAQTSALHSVIMWLLSLFIDDAVKIQQVYYLLNFSLISLISFIACRLLGIARLPALCVGFLFSFTTFRINEMLYAFLANYFMIPLSLVPVIWIITGVYRHLLDDIPDDVTTFERIKQLILSKPFLLGLLFVVLMTLSDGYYAFFTLLLLGFSILVRLCSGDLKSPLAFLPPFVFVASLMLVSLVLIWPLHVYKQQHKDEFYPNGVLDSSLIKHAFEAEVYSSTLKMMLAPPPNHHIKQFAKLGKWLVETSDGARLFKNGRNLVPLGTIGSILFGISLLYLSVPSLRMRRILRHNTEGGLPHEDLGNAFLSLILFIFLCSILGGVGTLVALVFPTIRSYDRFPLFLIFVLYAAAAYWISIKLKTAPISRRSIYSIGLIILTGVGLYDQIPNNTSIGDKQSKETFLAERNFVKLIEKSLPVGSMIYQYPYSQYLRNNKYYGWGSFSHVRLYLHSTALRWSNGAAKNSAVENWHLKLMSLPFNELLKEVNSIGFAGIVIDRNVLPQQEYLRLKRALSILGTEIIEDISSQLTYAKFNDIGFHLDYNPDYKTIKSLTITNIHLFNEDNLPSLIDKTMLRKLLTYQLKEFNSLEIDSVAHPDVFLSGADLLRGSGEIPIQPLTDMQGDISCSISSGTSQAKLSDTVIITIKNKSNFNWQFESGAYPLQVGVHIRRLDGSLLRWDDGLRLSSQMGTEIIDDNIAANGTLVIPKGETGILRFPLLKLNIAEFSSNNQGFIADFRLVQDGHAWFEHLGCAVELKN